MRYSSATERRPQLLNGWGLALIGVLTLIVLALVFPRQSVLTLRPGDKADGVSIAYAELLLKSKPDDQELRLRLIEQLLALGNLSQAEAHLAKLGDQAQEPAAQLLALGVKLQRAFADPAGLRESQRQEYARLLTGLVERELSVAQLQQVAELALLFNEPQLAADSYARLAGRDPENANYWLDISARWSRAAGNEAMAAALYQRLIKLSASLDEREHYQLAVFTSLVAAGDGTRALRWLDRHLAELRPSGQALELLQAGIREARGHSDFARANAYLQRWQELQPNDELWLEQAFALTLAMGKLEQAWELGLQLSAIRPTDQQLNRQLAQLGEWAGRPAEALPLWTALARQDRLQADYEHAWRLAGQLFDYQQMSVLLEELAEVRALSLEELKALVFALESQARPEQAREWLTLYVHRRPRERAGWQMLVQINRNMQQLQAEAEAWQAMAGKHRLTVKERVEWASVYWQLFAPQKAWEVLANVPLGKNSDADFLRLRSDLAWALEMDAESQRSLELLQAQSGSLSSDLTERLLTLYQSSDPQKALQLAVEVWRRNKSLGRLALALQLASEQGKWRLMDDLLREAEPYAQQLEAEPVYWQAQISQASRQGDNGRIDRLLASLLQRFPGQAWVIERYLWTQIDRQQTSGLAALLNTWRVEARRQGSLWLPFAAAYSLLGEVPESLRWYRLYTQANPKDLLTLAAYADTLELAGQNDSAWRLRRYLLQQWQRHRASGEQLQPQQFNTYLRMLASVSGAQRARLVSEQALQAAAADESASGPLLEQWFERWLAQLQGLNQTGGLDAWLAWARQRGIKIDSHAQLQSALRAMRREELQHWLASGELPADSRAEIWLRLGLDQRALAEALPALHERRAPGQAQTLRNQAQGVLERQPQGIQLGWQNRDFGGLQQKGEQWLMAAGWADRYVHLAVADGTYSGSELIEEPRLGREQSLRLGLDSPLTDGEWRALLDVSQNDFDNRQGLALERRWQVADSEQLALGLEWQVQAEESGLLHALGARDSLYATGQHGLSVRDQLSWRLARNRFTTAAGSALGRGWAASFELSHNLLAREPQWLLRSGMAWQENSHVSDLPDYLFISQGGVLRDPVDDDPDTDEVNESVPGAIVDDLLTSRFGEVYVGSSWQRGSPGALNRYWPAFTYKVDAKVGWQVPDRRYAYAFEGGAGIELFGDDELALLGGYSSAPVGGSGQSGRQLRLAYSLRFGR